MWRVVVSALAVSALLLVACGPTPRPVRYGGLTAFEGRPLVFEHGIELVRVRNGMTVALIPDPRTNLVTVDVRYLVGAAEDPQARAGMAHLVEHLMFTSASAAGGPTLGDQLGDVTLSYNAWTTWDETHYTSTALAGQLDAVLALEARRLQTTCDQLDDAVFLRERDVVLEEHAQRSDSSDALLAALIVATFGSHHPYARSVGSREIADATRAEACAFIEGHYAPDRAILVVNGNFDTAAASKVIGQQFGPITRHSSLPRAAIDPPDLEGFASEHRASVDEASAVVFFEQPAWGGEGAVYHDFGARLLYGKLAVLDREQAWITDVAIGQVGGGRQRAMAVLVSVADPARLDDAVEAIYDRVEHVLDDVSNTEFDRHRGAVMTGYLASYDAFVRRGPWIADFLEYTVDNMFMLREMALTHRATSGQVATYMKRTWTRARSNVARILPSGETSSEVRATVVSVGSHELQPWRTPVDPAEATRPLAGGSRAPAEITRLDLPNGLRVLMTPDPDSPIVDLRMVFPVGSAADPAERSGVAALAAYLLDHDRKRLYQRDDYRRIDWATSLGTQLDADVDETTTTFRATGLALFADWHLWRLFWLLDLGVYNSDDVAALHARARALVDDDDDEVDVRATALRGKLFGADHPYAASHDDPAVLLKIGAGELERFRARYYRAPGATLVIAGAFDLAAMRAEIETLFGAWDDQPPEAPPSVPAVEPAAGPSWIGVRDDDQVQPQITVAFATRSSPDRDRAARLILAEMVEDRVREVREGLGVSYGVSAGYRQYAAGGALILDGLVDPRGAAPALAAMLDAVILVRDDAATLAEDFVRARRRALAAVLADSSGAAAQAGELAYIAANQLPLDHFEALARQVSATTPEEVAAVAALDLADAQMVVVVSGRDDVAKLAFQNGAPAGTKVEWLDAD